MKSIFKENCGQIMIPLFCFFLIIIIAGNALGQSNCTAPKDHGLGYSSAISSVTLNQNGSYTIEIRVRHNGCPGPECNAINHYYVEAEPGTYSDISYALIYGAVSYNGIVFGPDLGGWDKQGFKISSINGMGNGDAGIFSVTYTLTNIQDQTFMVKAGNNLLEVFFSIEEFEYVQNCTLGGVYAMPAGGKDTYVSNKIGPELTALSEYNGTPETNEVYTIVYDELTGIYYVVVEFTPIINQYSVLLNLLETNFGARLIVPDNNQQVITAQIPINQLIYLNSLPSLLSAAPVYPVTTNTGLLATSQGDTSMLSNISRDIFTVSLAENSRRSIIGEGVKIGIISNSFNTKTNPDNQANDDVLKFELPGIGIQSDGTEVLNPHNNTNVHVIKEFAYGEASDEGRAMMQIIHDVAPGADLAFRTGVLGAIDMAAGINDLADADCHVIVDDITYISEPFFEDGIVAQAVNTAVSNDIAYFTSAGNFGEKSYTSAFNPASTNVNGIYGIPHNFAIEGDEDVYQSATALVSENSNSPLYFTIVLQWEDDDPSSTFYSTNTDLDIYISSGNGGLIGYNSVNLGEKAIEVLPFVVTETTDINLIIAKTSDNDVNVNFKYIVFKGQFSINEYTSGNSTIIGHANSEGAMTVGAIRYDKTPAYNGTLEIMSYSSRGGHPVNGVDRNKPDFTAPNGVNTTVDLGNGDWDHLSDSEADTDLLPNFFGTSAAAPHAAAVSALMLDASSSYYDVAMNPEEIRLALSSSAIGSGTYDANYGNGFIQADAALFSIANPAPVLYDISNIVGNPGIEPVTITVTGSYFTPETSVYFNGSIMSTTVDLEAGILQAELPPFAELYPPITAYNPPREGTNGKDGGMSNALYFTQKPTIVGTFEDTSKTYGQSMPEVSMSYEIVYFSGESVSLQDSDLTDSQIDRIYSIELQNSADALANAGIWPYYVDPHDWLNPLYIPPDPIIEPTEDETFLLDNYNFVFNIGDLEIYKLDLTITPEDLTFNYGEAITAFSYSFEYDDSDITTENNEIIQSELLAAYEGDMISDVTALIDTAFYMADSMGGLVPNSYFMSANAYDACIENAQSLALVNGQSLALVNGQSLALVNGQSLALVNSQSLALVNGQSLALVNAAELVSGQSLALVNDLSQLNGQSLALVNAQSLALVNNPPDWSDPAIINAQSLALVNTEALVNAQSLALVNEGGGLLNGQSLALVNSVTFNEITNDDAIIILTVDDIVTMNDASSSNTIELISINTISGINATDPENPHKISPGAFIASNFNVSYGLGNLTINKANLEVTGDSHVINEGSEAPPYSFNYDGFIDPDDAQTIFGLDGPDYSIINPDDNSNYDSITSGPGKYLIVFPSILNYNIIFPYDINLYVNPDGNGTKSVVPILDCVTNDGDGNYMAYFYYDNKNEETVWALIGPDNLVSGGGNPDISQQPFEFLPGGGVWEASFDGTEMTWMVSSQHHGHKTSIAQDASSNSKKCNKSSEIGLQGDSSDSGLRYFPNPFTNKLTVTVNEASLINEVSVYTIYGKLCLQKIHRISKNKVELNMSVLPAGVYFVNVNINGLIETFKVVKK